MSVLSEYEASTGDKPEEYLRETAGAMRTVLKSKTGDTTLSLNKSDPELIDAIADLVESQRKEIERLTPMEEQLRNAGAIVEGLKAAGRLQVLEVKKAHSEAHKVRSEAAAYGRVVSDAEAALASLRSTTGDDSIPTSLNSPQFTQWLGRMMEKK